MRCVLWWGETCVLIGCLDGRLCEWRVGEEVRKVCDIEGSVIVMKWSHTRNVSAVFVILQEFSHPVHCRVY